MKLTLINLVNNYSTAHGNEAKRSYSLSRTFYVITRKVYCPLTIPKLFPKVSLEQDTQYPLSKIPSIP